MAKTRRRRARPQPQKAGAATPASSAVVYSALADDTALRSSSLSPHAQKVLESAGRMMKKYRRTFELLAKL
jgi:hypothetical protein